MINHKKLLQDSAEFFNKEVDKIIEKISATKSEKQRDLYIKQMVALKNRLQLEIKMIDKHSDF